jgi:hypothetical protein
MSPEKSSYLINKYPKVFTKNCDFDCGDGWFTLLEYLASNLTAHIVSLDRVRFGEKERAESSKSDNQDEMTPEEEHTENVFHTDRVKQKFGTLRFGELGGDAFTYGMIRFAESISETICENCGDKATEKTKGWLSHLCRSCFIIDDFARKGFNLEKGDANEKS